MKKLIPQFKEKQNELTALVKRLRKGDVAAQQRLQELLQDPDHRVILSKTFKLTPEHMARQAKKAREERIKYKGISGRPVQGGGPGLGKKS